MKKYIIGIDPGKTGAIAMLDDDGELITMDDMPAIGKHVSVALLKNIFHECQKCAEPRLGERVTCVIEDVYSSPQMGVTSAFSFGRSKGAVEAMAAGLGMRLVYVTPAKWKKDMSLTKNKGHSRALATQRWPADAELFKRVKDDGRAEAALVALWHVRFGNE